MRVLVALETATGLGSVAVGQGPVLLGEVTIGTVARHAESLLPALDFLLRSGGIDRRGIAGIVVGAGPGSFTGVRVAAATARGLAHGLDVPLYAYSSLAALALAAPGDGERPVCALLDARRNEVYAACYRYDRGSDRLTTVFAPDALGLAALRARLPVPAPVFVGEGAERYAAELDIAPPPPAAPRAAALLRLAAADPEGGLVAEPAGWEPAYLRASGAERGITG